MDKQDLRRRIRAARVGRTAGARFPDRVLAAIPHGPVCCYVDLPGEPPTGPVIEALLARGDEVFLPVAGTGGLLAWVSAREARPWRAWGVPGQPPAPVATTALPLVETIIVPALAVDGRGVRLGQGGGYYDRFVPTQPQARTVALIWSGEVLDSVAGEPHDIRVDAWVVADG